MKFLAFQMCHYMVFFSDIVTLLLLFRLFSEPDPNMSKHFGRLSENWVGFLKFKTVYLVNNHVLQHNAAYSNANAKAPIMIH